MDGISLRLVTRSNWQDTLQLAVHPEQQQFVADYAPIALLGLAKAYVRPGGLMWEPYAVYVVAAAGQPAETVAEQTMVGFLELAYGPGSADEYWLFHFFIDQRFQGHGYAKAALAELIKLVAREHPTCQALQLVMHPQNTRAQRLYLDAGFRPTGGERWGEPVYCLHLGGAENMPEP
jgi:diamine N-acetyltransferase